MARSIGIRLAATDVILMVDSNVILNPSLYHHKKLLRLPEVGSVNAPLELSAIDSSRRAILPSLRYAVS